MTILIVQGMVKHQKYVWNQSSLDQSRVIVLKEKNAQVQIGEWLLSNVIIRKYFVKSARPSLFVTAFHFL